MKKKIFLLASVALGAALVGGTFANWAVTDNADPFSIKVSTGEVSTDDAEYVTLEWGDSQSMSNVSNLALDTVRKVGVLDLRANTTSNNQPNGTLSFTKAGGSHLLAALEIKVYEGNLAATGGVISSETIAAATQVSLTNDAAVIDVDKNAANLFTVAVNLADGTDAADLDAMTGEQVTLTFDWAKGTNVIEALTLYATGFDTTPYVYAWNGSSQNKTFPGIEMTPVTGAAGYYTAQVNTSFTKVIFSGTKNSEAVQSGDIVVSESFTAGKNLFTYDGTSGDAKGTFSVMSDVKEPEYYVVGSFTTPAWSVDPAIIAANKMTYVAASGEPGHEGYNPEHYSKTGLVLAAGAKLKGFELNSKAYFGDAETWEGCGFTIDGDGNVVIPEGKAGTYTINLYLNATNGNFITIAKTA